MSAQPFVTRVYTASQGLPDSYTLGVYQDRQGYLWIGTYTGLCRFDGQQFESAWPKKESQAMSANVLLQDHLGRLWINYDTTIAWLQRDTLISFPTEDHRPINYVFGAIQLDDGRIWALVDKGAYEFADSMWRKVIFPEPFHGLNCRQVIESAEGLYINFESHIVLIRPDGSYQMLTPVEESAFYINIQKSGESIYALRVNGMIEIRDGKIYERFTNQLAKTTCYNFLLDSRNRFWISTEADGILVSSPGNLEHLDHRVSLPFNLSTFLFEDRDHRVWATNFEGLIRISEVDFTRFDADRHPAFDNIRCLAASPEGDIVMATSGIGLFVLRHGEIHPQPYRVEGIKGFNNFVVDAMAFQDRTTLWLVTRDRRPIKLKDRKASDLTHLLPPGNGGFTDIRFDHRRNKIWVAAERIYIGDSRGFVSSGQFFQTAEVPGPLYLCLRNDGSALASTQDGELLYLREGQPLTNIIGLWESPVKARQIRPYEDPENGLWVSQLGMGLAYFTMDHEGRVQHRTSLTIEDGLPHNTVISAVFDGQQRLWVSTLSGLASITYSGNGPGRQFKIDRVGEELSSLVLNWSLTGFNMAYDQQDQVFVSTLHELIRYDISKPTLQPLPPGIAIENVKLRGKRALSRMPGDSTAGYFQLPVNPTWPYRDNNISITYKGISYSDNPGLTYSYALSGPHENHLRSHDVIHWSEPTSSHEVSFVGLSPGRYLFSVRVREAGNIWSAPAEFPFTITTPFWMTWWFRGIGIILAGILIWAFIRYRTNQIRRKADVRQQLSDLEMKALKAQMNPHFIYNALNSIQALVMDGKQQEAVKYISKFARLLREILEHSGANLITLEKELHTLNLYVQLEMLRMNAQLEYSVHMDDNILPEKEWVPPLILQPFIENALWHGLSRKKGEKKLRMEIHPDDEWLTIVITDNGIGRQKAEEYKSGQMAYPRSMGMQITGKRLQVINREEAETIHIHDMKDADDRAAGTQVRIRLRRQQKVSAPT